MFTFKLFNGPGISVRVDLYKDGVYWGKGEILCSEKAARNWAAQQGLKELV